MIIAHLADLHLGYRAYHRSDAGGFNVREADVVDAFRRSSDALVALAPDLILVAGDVFHSVRPSNSAIAAAFRLFSSLTERLPGTPVIVIAGDHESPRSTETANILTLLREVPGLLVVTDEAVRITLPELDCSVLCVPHIALAQQQGGAGMPVDLEPDPSAAHNVLMLHGLVTGAAAARKLRAGPGYGGIPVAESSMLPERWDYVALGHHHVATELAHNMWYSGALERTSTSIWQEAAAAKGFLTFDTESSTASFHPVATRTVIDLEPLQARGLNAAEVDERLRVAVESIDGGLQGKMVRLVIEDLPRQVLRDLNHRRIREYKAAALHFHLDARPPPLRGGALRGAPGTRRPLEEQVQEFLRRDWELSSDSLQRDRLVALGAEYLRSVEDDGTEVR